MSSLRVLSVAVLFTSSTVMLVQFTTADIRVPDCGTRCGSSGAGLWTNELGRPFDAESPAVLVVSNQSWFRQGNGSIVLASPTAKALVGTGSYVHISYNLKVSGLLTIGTMNHFENTPKNVIIDGTLTTGEGTRLDMEGNKLVVGKGSYLSIGDRVIVSLGLRLQRVTSFATLVLAENAGMTIGDQSSLGGGVWGQLNIAGTAHFGTASRTALYSTMTLEKASELSTGDHSFLSVGVFGYRDPLPGTLDLEGYATIGDSSILNVNGTLKMSRGNASLGSELHTGTQSRLSVARNGAVNILNGGSLRLADSARLTVYAQSQVSIVSGLLGLASGAGLTVDSYLSVELTGKVLIGESSHIELATATPKSLHCRQTSDIIIPSSGETQRVYTTDPIFKAHFSCQEEVKPMPKLFEILSRH